MHKLSTRLKSIVINGRRYRLRFDLHNNNRDGECDSPREKNKTIRINPRVLRNPRRLMATLLHESLHAACWDLDEEWVQDTSDSLERLLYRAGYRLVDERDVDA